MNEFYIDTEVGDANPLSFSSSPPSFNFSLFFWDIFLDATVEAYFDGLLEGEVGDLSLVIVFLFIGEASAVACLDIVYFFYNPVGAVIASLSGVSALELAQITSIYLVAKL